MASHITKKVYWVIGFILSSKVSLCVEAAMNKNWLNMVGLMLEYMLQDYKLKKKLDSKKTFLKNLLTLLNVQFCDKNSMKNSNVWRDKKCRLSITGWICNPDHTFQKGLYNQRLRKKLCDEMFWFSLMDMQCSFL